MPVSVAFSVVAEDSSFTPSSPGPGAASVMPSTVTIQDQVWGLSHSDTVTWHLQGITQAAANAAAVTVTGTQHHSTVLNRR